MILDNQKLIKKKVWKAVVMITTSVVDEMGWLRCASYFWFGYFTLYCLIEVIPVRFVSVGVFLSIIQARDASAAGNIRVFAFSWVSSSLASWPNCWKPRFRSNKFPNLNPSFFTAGNSQAWRRLRESCA